MPPLFGAIPSQDGVRFTVWAPAATRLELHIHDGAAAGSHALARDESGVHQTWVRDARAGDRYSYSLDGGEDLPDPASRFQPDGVHRASQVVDPSSYGWRDSRWHPREPPDAIVYELHVGTFTPEGTFDGVCARLPYLRDLGITTIELMPVADFAGQRNWGYDGVALYAPSRAYGSPDDLRALVDAAHAHGLSMMIDVVYNHVGPEGAYLARFSPAFFTNRYQTPWGAAVNLDGAESEMVRRFIVDNACHWIREYHFDGLRLDATHALIDHGPKHIVQEITEAVRAEAQRHIVVHAEDHRNLATMIEDVRAGGWGLDGVWADDFHHVVRAMVAGDQHGYYADFAGQARELETIVRDGWLYSGAHSRFLERARGTHPGNVPMHRFVVCVQNHDQIGNRALGERLHHEIPAETWRAVSVLLLMVPMTPFLFMGQEWAASTPFQFFTDLEPGLGRLVTEGRRREFAAFPGFTDPEGMSRIPDPQAETTFLNSRLKWDEVSAGRHGRSLALYRALIALRLDHHALTGSTRTSGSAAARDDDGIVIRRSEGDTTFWIVGRFRSGGDINLADAAEAMGQQLDEGALDVVLDTEHAEFADDPAPIDVTGRLVTFQRPGAVILRQG
jgi:maltooligosyltrehalose trehalohydrolase